MKLKESFVLSEVAGQAVVVPTGKELDLSRMITLNGAGKLLWERLAKGAEAEDLVAALLEEYDVDKETAAKDVAAFVKKLENNGCLQ